MNNGIRTKLSVMMFLEYVVWGAWLPLLNVYLGNAYLGFTDTRAAWIQNTFAIASLIGMFFGGQLADRYFAQEKFLAFSHLVALGLEGRRVGRGLTVEGSRQSGDDLHAHSPRSSSSRRNTPSQSPAGVIATEHGASAGDRSIRAH